MRRFLCTLALYSILPLALLAVAMLHYHKQESEGFYDGDLARMSGIPFNYSSPSNAIATPHRACRTIKNDSSFVVRYGEWCILGDSFSHIDLEGSTGRISFPQYLSALLDKDLVVYLVANPVYTFVRQLLTQPSMLGDTVVVETVEREAIERLTSPAVTAAFNHHSAPLPMPETMSATPWQQHTSLYRTLAHYRRRIVNDSVVRSFPLDGVYFSTNDSMLYCFFEDLDPLPLQSTLSTAFFNLSRIVELAEERGIYMLFVIVPDKYSVYQPHVLTPHTQRRLLNTPTPLDSSAHFINPLSALQNLVETGVVDVYLPDDTHLSNRGALELAKVIASHFYRQSAPDAELAEE